MRSIGSHGTSRRKEGSKERIPAVHGVLGCNQKSFMLVLCHCTTTSCPRSANDVGVTERKLGALPGDSYGMIPRLQMTSVGSKQHFRVGDEREIYIGNYTKIRCLYLIKKISLLSQTSGWGTTPLLLSYIVAYIFYRVPENCIFYSKSALCNMRSTQLNFLGCIYNYFRRIVCNTNTLQFKVYNAFEN
jgi:hypothetical protein